MKKILFLSAALSAFVAGTTAQANSQWYVGVAATYNRTNLEMGAPDSVTNPGGVSMMNLGGNAVLVQSVRKGMTHGDILGGEIMVGNQRQFGNCPNVFWGMRGYVGMTGGKVTAMGWNMVDPQIPNAVDATKSVVDSAGAQVPDAATGLSFNGLVTYTPLFNTGIDLLLGRSVSENWAVYGGLALDLTVARWKVTGPYSYYLETVGTAPAAGTAVTGSQSGKTGATFSVVPHFGVACGLNSQWAVFVDAGYSVGLVTSNPSEANYGHVVSRPHGFKLSMGMTYTL